jgi:protein-disulfide isomerase
MSEKPMSEENGVVETSVAQTTPTAVVSKERISKKDMLVPLSIIVAGIFVGVGLYFSGGSVQNVAGVPTPTDTPEPEVVDTTSKINPVTDADHIKGNPNAPVKIVEYSDFECPFCKRHHETLQGVVDKLGGETVAWVFRQFPLEQLHPVKAMAAAMGSECVAELGGNDAFWNFTDSYFEETLTNNRTDTDTLIPKLALESGVNREAFTECFESQRHKAAIEADIADAVETGGRGTPWSVIIGPTGKTYPVNGAMPASVIEQMIQVAIDEA